MEQFLQLIRDTGPWIYLLVFTTAASRSGLTGLFAGYAAAIGLLQLWPAVLAAALGTIMGDEVRFWVGRRWGATLLKRFPRIAAVAEKAVRILERHGLWYVWIYRYVTGVRTIGAIPVGMTTWPRWRFSLANLGAGTVWAGATTAAGYLFADVWTSDRLQTANLIALGLLLGLMALGWWAWRRLDAERA